MKCGKGRTEDYFISVLLDDIDEMRSIIGNGICRIGFDICQNTTRYSSSNEIVSILCRRRNIKRNVTTHLN